MKKIVPILNLIIGAGVAVFAAIVLGTIAANVSLGSTTGLPLIVASLPLLIGTTVATAVSLVLNIVFFGSKAVKVAFALSALAVAQLIVAYVLLATY